MLNRITAHTLAAAIAFTSMPAAQAHADTSDKDVLKLLAGLATVAIIAKTVEDNNSRKAEKRNRPPVVVQAPRGHPKHSGPVRGQVTPYYAPRPKTPKWPRLWVPAKCQQAVRTGNGTRYVYGDSCLKRIGLRASLPQQCKLRVNVRGRSSAAWGHNCLRRAGYHFQ
ncbi:hypothetical protein IV417_10470 [Alphaproteobacteria bacterium KMM 3653]|uniref:Uncharacterized protein n=1 Tax=Harenicola maris TaxID=2841044 RepID=A0AAP2CNQ4_9RHOB|nr:hypothetical protein [Harenicola maris]